MRIDNNLVKTIIAEAKDKSENWERVTVILNKPDYDKLKSISDIKEIFVKDIISDLIRIYNENAITDKDEKNIQEEKIKLTEEIKKLVGIQEDEKEQEDQTETE